MHVLHDYGCAKRGPENEANMRCRARMPILPTVQSGVASCGDDGDGAATEDVRRQTLLLRQPLPGHADLPAAGDGCLPHTPGTRRPKILWTGMEKAPVCRAILEAMSAKMQL